MYTGCTLSTDWAALSLHHGRIHTRSGDLAYLCRTLHMIRLKVKLWMKWLEKSGQIEKIQDGRLKHVFLNASCGIIVMRVIVVFTLTVVDDFRRFFN